MDPSSFPGEEKVFIGSPWSNHVPNGRQNDIPRGLLEAKWSPGMAFGVFGGSWVSIGAPSGLRELILIDLGFPLRFLVVIEGQLDTLFCSKSYFERDCVLLGNRRAAYTGSSFSCIGPSLWMPKHVTDQSLARCSIFSCPKGVPVAMRRQ